MHAQTTPPAENKNNRCLRVLVIDDNPADRELAIIHLAEVWPFERDLTVDTASGGAEALEKIPTGHFNLIVMDWHMPEVGGGDVLRALRKNGVRVPVVVVSGMPRADISEDIESLGAAFVNKNEMNAESFRNAIAASLCLLGFTRPTTATAENQTRLKEAAHIGSTETMVARG